jgi:hypothetical protein
MWSWVLRDLGPRVTANCTSKLQTRPLVRKGAPQHERKCPTVIQIWSWITDEGLTPRRTGRLTVGHNITWTWVREFGGGLEYFHRSTASHKRLRKGNPLSGGISRSPCTWGMWIRGPGVSNETAKYGRQFYGTRTRKWLLWQGLYE